MPLSGRGDTWVSSLARMSSKSERRAAREIVAEYHEACLAELVERAGGGIDGFRAGQLDAFEADQVTFSTAVPRRSCGSSATLPTSSSPPA
jgi:hypothetical protein